MFIAEYAERAARAENLAEQIDQLSHFHIERQLANVRQCKQDYTNSEETRLLR